MSSHHQKKTRSEKGNGASSTPSVQWKFCACSPELPFKKSDCLKAAMLLGSPVPVSKDTLE